MTVPRQYTADVVNQLIENVTYTISMDEKMTIQCDFKHYMMEVEHATN